MSFNFLGTKVFFLICLAILVCGAVIYHKPQFIYNTIKYSNPSMETATQATTLEMPTAEVTPIEPTHESILKPVADNLPVTHIKTPENVRALYVSAWIAGSSKSFPRIVKIADDTEVNALVVDIKDSTGRISYAVSDPELAKFKSSQNRISNIRALTRLLHQHNIYIIGRISVFQDPYMTALKPEWAITKKSDGTVWKDRKGLSFLDPANKNVHDYVVSIARDAYDEGFDEINFDYIRYPSDGEISNINYHLAPGKTRADNIESFFKYLHQEVKKGKDIPMSADLFGLTTEAGDDMGIGQVWGKALPYFDYLAPMVYPSHYPSGHMGFKKPAEHPYEIINTAMKGAITKTKLIPNEDIKKIRPWIQDFNLGAIYTKDMIRDQMKAAYDNGIMSWMIWDPSNKYTVSALELENTQ